MRVAVYAIARDEAAFAERFVSAAREADCVVVADTGSTDGCPDALRAQGAIVHQISVTPWRFDDARNAALALVPSDVEVCLSLDLDEVVAPGWRALLEAGWTREATRAFYTFVASHDAKGADGVTFLNNRMHLRHGYRWRHACHEGLYPDRIEEHFVSIPAIRVDHWPDESKSRSSYLELLTVAVAEEPNDPRMAHYHARELFFHARYGEALDAFVRYLAIGDASLTGERAASLLYGARGLDALERSDEAMRWRWRAVAECPQMREPWCDLAEALYKVADWPGCYGAAKTALSRTEPAGGYMTEARAWAFTPDDLAAIAAWNLGLKAESLAHAERALAFAPDDARLIANVELIRKELEPTAQSPADSPADPRRGKGP